MSTCEKCGRETQPREYLPGSQAEAVHTATGAVSCHHREDFQ